MNKECNLQIMSFGLSKKFIFVILVFLLIGVFAFSINFSIADDGIVPDDGKKATGNYTLNDFVQVAVNVSNWILGIVGSLALLMFIYGGVMFLISSGNSEKVTQAKQTISSAVIGLVIVFTSYMIISFAAQALGIEEGKNILQTGWFSK